MRTCSDESEDKIFSIEQVNKEPIRCNMAFAEMGVIAGQGMVFILRRKRFPFRKQGDYFNKKFDLQSSFDRLLEILFELGSAFDRIFHEFRSFIKSSTFSKAFPVLFFDIRRASSMARTVSSLGEDMPTVKGICRVATALRRKMLQAVERFSPRLLKSSSASCLS